MIPPEATTQAATPSPAISGAAPPRAARVDADRRDAAPGRTVRVALAHDWLVGYRGGEAVLDRIARLVTGSMPHARPRLYTMFDDGGPLSDALDALPRRRAWLGRLPLASTRLRRWLLPLYPAAVESLSRRLARDHAREPIDLLISTSSAAIKGLRPPPGVPHLCYCHTPARYLWSQAEQYAQGRSGRLRGAGLSLFGARLRRWDAASSAHVTHFLANSTHTAAQIREHYGRESTVVHPPVRTAFFTPDAGAARTDRWLLVGALEPYKRVDIAIEAANRAGRPLTIVGRGSQRSHLRALAGPTVAFADRVSDEELRDLYRTSRLLLFPQVEDFGIVAAEALACGLPVVARRAGGALDTVEDGATGVLFDDPTPGALLDAIGRAPDPARAAHACRAGAQRFSEAAFDAALRTAIDLALNDRP